MNYDSDSDDFLMDPQAHGLQPTAMERHYYPDGSRSLSGIALRAFALGAGFSVALSTCLLVLLATSSPLWRLFFFFAALCLFHFLEFWTTAQYNTREARVSSFLLTANWPVYLIAHTTASAECLLTKLLLPFIAGRQEAWAWAPWSRTTGPALLSLGLTFVVAGQTVRAMAMAQMGHNFNHRVQNTKKSDHELVTTGLYSIMRHPAYAGFFWWGLGTQMVMGNPLCFVAYAVALWRFFSARTRFEERALTQFFPRQYPEYQKRVPTLIPFLP